jgi:fructose-bisphosphate aldolase class II
MTNVSTAELVARAVRDETFALALNVITLEHAEAILSGAELAQSSVILQVSENAIRYHRGGVPLLAACAALVEDHGASASIHLDHVTDVELLGLARSDLGVSSVMYDASELPYDDNVARTRAVTEDLHALGLWVEAELGAIGGKGGAHAPGVRTDPQEAAEYVAATGVDGLAVAVGSTHAMTSQTASLDIDLVRSIAAAVPVPLVLHGSSGVPPDQLREAADVGIRKINVGTALNVAFTGAVREALVDEALTDPRRYLGPARDATAASVRQILEELR